MLRADVGQNLREKSGGCEKAVQRGGGLAEIYKMMENPGELACDFVDNHSGQHKKFKV